MDDKIQEAFVKHFPATHASTTITNMEKFFFAEGYKAALANLETVTILSTGYPNGIETIYRVKEELSKVKINEQS